MDQILDAGWGIEFLFFHADGPFAGPIINRTIMGMGTALFLRGGCDHAGAHAGHYSFSN